MFQMPTTTSTTMTTATQTQAPLFAGLEARYPFTTTTSGAVEGGAAEDEEWKDKFTTLFGPSITAREPTPLDSAPTAAQDGVAVSFSPCSSLPPSSSPRPPSPCPSASAGQKGTVLASSGLRRHKRKVAGFKVVLGRLRVRNALSGGDDGVREESGGAEGEMGGEVDFNRFERRRGSGFCGAVGLEKGMGEGFEGSGEDFGEVGAGERGQGAGKVGSEGEVEGEDQGQVEDDDEDDAEAGAEGYGDEDEESGPEEASLDDLLLSTDLLSLSDSKAMYAQWKDRKPSKPTPRTDDIKEQEEIDIAFVEAIHATNAIKWGNSASIRDISPSSNNTSTNKTSQKRPSTRATQQTPFKLHVPRDCSKSP
ncbi:hypothetical protein KC345_g7432 [Hortaea werneckii]|nr:hypothetical protein KC345_g7432 [Hortaea werneckii]